ncbi:family 1 glycosylhydrolase [Compostimonas suwonensis]|uniref:Beta-glucosidase/6-phospho-beta-glucosidase/beta-galactosidase n=1 Tax=Compostimonas suwonensis TaxID=1048394 RepID=A0A2M9BCI4_9MICO|nr:family 1 glycosylhydrolase [Compostimonas suwonensis]PJJ55650.1 beta-glucosidase/6-phospho-beta-glucosidase/beta-galactosidase [Compostimonas suwonensis]
MTKWFDDGALHFALGIEDTFVPQERPGERAVDEYELTEHYTQWRSDLELVRESGAEMLRWGVPWHRVNPAPGEWDWSWLDAVMARFGELGIRPIVDLLHYGTPLWLEGEFANPDYPQRVAEYSVAVAERYRDVVTDYTPVNEPMIHALFSGEYGYWPPYRTGPGGLVEISAAIARGFVLSQRGIAEVLGDAATFVHVDAGFRYTGDAEAPEHRGTALRLRRQSYLVEDLVTGRVDDAHPLRPLLSENGMTDAALSWFGEAPVRPHVMGVNYYPRHSTEVFEAGVQHGGGFADPRPTRDDGVDGLLEVLRAYAERYGAPVMLTETCVTGTVDERIAWLDASVDAVVAAKARGLPIVGYTWWPLFDMYEWTYRHSTAAREEHLLSMGLWDLVETPSRLERRRNPVADRFAHHAREARGASSERRPQQPQQAQQSQQNSTTDHPEPRG